MTPFRRLLPLPLAALLLLGLPAAAAAWAGAQHIQINRAAGRNVPDEMAPFRAFSRPMVFPSIYPDLWKGADLDEEPRHYFEPDRLPPGTNLRDLPRDQAAALAALRLRPDLVGIAPWTILDLLGQMTDAMRTNDWLWAARCGATLSHYVADLHMPLHCTANFNGQETGQHGIHTRWESDMVKTFFRPDQISLEPAVHLDDPFRAVMDWTAHSASLVPAVLQADLAAKRSAGGRIDTEGYYRKLWELSSPLVAAQISSAASHLSSLWYTAWVDADKPPIPSPFDELPTLSVHSGVGIDPLFESAPAPAAPPRQKKTYDLIIWSVMAAIAALALASSLLRAFRSRRPPRT